MKILVAGATGAIGKPLVRKLVANGHEVAGMTRTPAKRDIVESLGATPVVADALDPDAVAAAVGDFEPDVIVHELTALSGGLDIRHMDRTFARTNRLRTEGTDHLLAAGRAVGVKRFVAQSFAGWLDAPPVKSMREMLAAIRHVEETVTGAEWTEGIVLRYGGFYGPGTSLTEGGEQLEAIRKRKFPIVGNGRGVLSLIHVEDGAEATVAAVEHGHRGVYTVVEDDSSPAAEWLPEVARQIGAKPPRHVPRAIGRLFAGEAAVVMMTELPAMSNEDAKRELGWAPKRSWREDLAA